jgi:hypothetical protein
MLPRLPLRARVPIVHPPGGERRASPRHLTHDFPDVRLLVRPSFQACPAYIRDVSEMGMGIVGEHVLQPGAVIAIQLQGLYADVLGIVRATVAHCTPLHKGGWLWGCRLSRRLAPDELDVLIKAVPELAVESDEWTEKPSMKLHLTRRRYPTRHAQAYLLFRSEDFAK